MDKELSSLNLTKNDYKKVYFDSLDNDNGWNLLSAEELERIGLIENAGNKLIDIADINCGLATLSDSIYLVDSTYKKSVEGKIFEIEPEICKPIIKASRTHSEEDIINNDLKIIWVYEKGKIIPENVLRKRYPNTYAYLHSMKSKLALRDRGKKDPCSWYAYGGRITGINIIVWRETLNFYNEYKTKFYTLQRKRFYIFCRISNKT